MKYRIENEFPCSGDEVMRTMFMEGITEKLLPDMNSVREAETLEWKEKNGVIQRRVRYLPVPAIKSVGPKKVDPRWMEWIEESQLDLRSRVVTYVNVPTTPGVARLLKNSGRMSVRDKPQGGCIREVAGELKVKVLLLGVVAERVIYSYAQEILRDEARALAGFIRASEGQSA
ncbi:MAG: DUF2505 family protein [Deltaproteobacteria bacterium]|nr:DUF2505 family protein [Deltaproteobacteria bacterium]